MKATVKPVLEAAESRLGAHLQPDGSCHFLVWAPNAREASVHLVSPADERRPMQRLERGYHFLRIERLATGTRYFFRLDERRDLPDPASRFQPMGPHGPSEVVAFDFAWSDSDWQGLALEDHIFYEIHAGAFTPEGSLDAMIPRLQDLTALGVTAIELMPLAQFPGTRNWGYDGTFPFAVQNSYGGPLALRRLVNACHRAGLAVILDVVYNHLGPEGNYLAHFGPYFTGRYRTPWGDAVNFDGPHSDEARRFFIENALAWITDFHLDGLRLDAIHAIFDFSATPFLAELASAVRQLASELGRRVHIFPESDLNDARCVDSPERGGVGLDAQWCDDFHHALHTLLTGETNGYYADYRGTAALTRSLREGYVLQGDYSAYRQRRHGNSSAHLPPRRFIVFSQNHDQVGNRLFGERLSALVDFESLKLAAATVILSPYLPLLFMGEEYAEPAPFQYFISHSDATLVDAVRKGRAREFRRFEWKQEVPDPQSEEVFARCRLNWSLREQGPHRAMLACYRELLHVRRALAPLRAVSRKCIEVHSTERPPLIQVHHRLNDEMALAVLHFGREPATVDLKLPAGQWEKRFDSADTQLRGPGSALPASIEGAVPARLSFNPRSAALYHAGRAGHRDPR